MLMNRNSILHKHTYICVKYLILHKHKYICVKFLLLFIRNDVMINSNTSYSALNHCTTYQKNILIMQKKNQCPFIGVV